MVLGVIVEAVSDLAMGYTRQGRDEIHYAAGI